MLEILPSPITQKINTYISQKWICSTGLKVHISVHQTSIKFAKGPQFGQETVEGDPAGKRWMDPEQL